MSKHRQVELAGLSASVVLAVDEACDDFERHWRRAVRRGDNSPSPEGFVERVPKEARNTLRSLLDELIVDLNTGPRFPLIPGYTFLAEMARGPMGIVYRVRRDGESRDLALKVIHALLSAEVEVLTRLCHPRIVPVESLGEFQGVPYLVMPLIEGGDLRSRRDEYLFTDCRPDRLEAIAALMEKVADAVAYLHQQGILHRDLKPSNILLVGPAPNSEPLVCDFGLARRIEEEVTPEIVGTLFYMAPEQMEGRGPITTAADLWSLGAILYELLTGSPPYSSGSVVDRTRKLSEEEPDSPDELNPAAVGNDLVRVCRRCLQRDPTARYGSASALRDDLRRCR